MAKGGFLSGGIHHNAPVVGVTGIWMRRRGLNVELLAEYNGEWRLLATENIDGAFSHIVEPGGIVGAPRDPAPPSPKQPERKI